MDYSKEDVIKLFADALNVKADIIKKEFDDLENVEVEELNETLKNVASDRFSHFGKTSKERALKQAKREERTKAEKELAEALGIEKMSFADQLEHLKEKQIGSGDGTNEKTKLTKEEIAKLPQFSELVSDIKKQVQTKEVELQELQQKYKSEKVRLKVKSKAVDMLSTLKADLGEDEATRKLRLEKFEKLLFVENKFDLDENDNIVILDKKGEPKSKNSMLDPYTLEDAVSSGWVWDLKKEEAPGNPRITNPNENSFNKNNFSYRKEELEDAATLFDKHNQAVKAGNKEEAAFLQDRLSELANSK